MSLKKIEKSLLWNFLNRPLIIIGIIALFLLLWGYKEKVRCDYMIHPDVDYLRNAWNKTDTEINLFLDLYSKPLVANLTFDNYQEALAAKQLWIDGQYHKKWYKPTLDCDTKKIKFSLEPKEIVNR